MDSNKNAQSKKKSSTRLNISHWPASRGPWLSLQSKQGTRYPFDDTYDCPEEVDEFTQNIIQDLRRPETANRHATITGYTTTDEHTNSWKKMSRHILQHLWTFSEIIAGTANVAIAEIDAAVVPIAVLTGYCSKRWSEAIDMMIPKKADSKYVAKLRIIVLFH
jgi:hypothetical protein